MLGGYICFEMEMTFLEQKHKNGEPLTIAHVSSQEGGGGGVIIFIRGI